MLPQQQKLLGLEGIVCPDTAYINTAGNGQAILIVSWVVAFNIFFMSTDIFRR